MKEQKELVKLDLEMHTENEHYNHHVVECVTECIKGQVFETPNEMWGYYFNGVNILIGNESPLDAVCKLMGSINPLTPEQSIFILERIAKYIKPSETEFNTWDFEMQYNTHKILSCYIENLQRMCDLRTPTKSIRNTITKVIQNERFKYIIPNGTAVQNARTSQLGDTLCRDVYCHLTLTLGRYIAGLTLVGTGADVDIREVTYSPNITELEKIIAIESVYNALNEPYKVTESSYK
jgi:hypothetical protein